MRRAALVLMLALAFFTCLMFAETVSFSSAEALKPAAPTVVQSQHAYANVPASLNNDNLSEDDTTQVPPIEEAELDPDLPSDVRGLDKEDYLRQREEYNGLRRGLEPGRPFDPLARGRAIRQMEIQEALQIERTKLSRSNANSYFGLAPTDVPVWTALGPSPLPSGFIGGPFTGRVTAVVVDPTNSNKVYLATAQGGVWRSLNGGTTWESIFDNAQTQAIGSLALAPSNPTILYVGTGESNRSADSFFGIGLYRIDNVDSSYSLVGPINPVFSYNNGSGIVNTTTFTGRSISQVVVHPTQPGTIFVATSTGVAGSGANSFDGNLLAPLGLYRSTNADGPIGAISFQKLAVATGGGSLDVPGTGNRRVTDVVMEPGNPDNLVVGVFGSAAPNDGGIFRSTNANDPSPTFTHALTISTTRIQLAINKSMATGAVKVLAATSEAPTLASCSVSTQQGVLRQSVDGGATWVNPADTTLPATPTSAGILTEAGGFCGGQCFYNVTVGIDPRDSNNIYLGGNVSGTCSGLILRSSNGVTFTSDSTGLHADSHALYFDPLTTPSTVFTGNDGGVWKRSAAAPPGTLWTNLNTPPLNTLQFEGLAVHPLDRNITLGGTQDNGTELQQTVSQIWSNAAGGDGGYALIDQSATDNVNVTMYHTFFFSTGSQIRYQRANTLAAAAANSWTNIGCTANTPANGITCTDRTLFYAPMALGPGTPNTVYLGTDRLYRSDNRGTSHAVVSQAPISGISPVSAIGISPQDDNYRVVGMQNGQVWSTSTGSASLVNITSGAFPANPNGSLTNRFVGAAVVDPNNKDVAYIAFSFFAPAGQGVWKITNLSSAAGAAPVAPIWTAASAGIPSVPINSLAVDPAHSNHIYAGTDIGVYQSTDGGATWNPYGTGLPRSAVFGVAIQNPHRVLRVATHGRGMWETSLPAAAPASTTQFSAAAATVSETPDATTKVDISVTRSGDASAPASIDYATADGSASERSDYLAAIGRLQFAAGETSKTITVFIVDDRYGEIPETFSVSLTNPVNSTTGTPSSILITINSNEVANGPNPVKEGGFDTDFFVRQQYIDFLNREADASGLGFWKNQIDECTTLACDEVRRVNVSAAFFVSIEFQETGYLVYKSYQAAFNQGEFLRLRDFLPDTQEIGRGVVIGQPGAGAQLDANKVRFFADFVNRAKFTEPANYPTTMTATQFVDKLNSNTVNPFNTGSGGALTATERTDLINLLSPNPSSASLRAQVLRRVAENSLFSTRQFNKAFVLMQYFGYLRRNPNDPPEAGLDFAGYNFWLNKLNSFNGNYIEAEMVRAFITSQEYEQRFGP